MGTVRIDPSIASLIPPLSEEESRQLEANVVAHGCRDPLVVWKEEGVLLDGHNRLAICEAHGIEYRTVAVSLPDRDAAEDWMDANQLGRRNLTPDQASLLRGRRYNRAKKAQGAPVGNDNRSKQRGQNVPFEGTADKLAAEHGVSARTIKRDGKFAESVEKVAKAAPDLPARVAKGEAPPKRTVTAAAALLDSAPDIAPLVLDGTLTIPDAKKLTQLDAPTRSRAVERIERGEAKSVRDAVRVARREEYEARVEESGPVPLPDGPFRVLYADPPWSYGNSGLDEYGHAERHYRTMTTDDLCELGVPAIAADDAVLFLWATSPLLEDALRVLRAWGFTYKSSFVWDKVKHNFGYYNSVRHEFLLVGTRGSCLPDEKKLFDSVVTLERSERHSEKPEEFRSIINTLYPVGPHVELFARCPVEGWAVWGNEA